MEVIVAEGLAKMYPNGVWGAIDITFSLRDRQLAVLLGPNGAGKTTTIGMLTTLLKPTKGRGYVMGFDIVREAREVRRRIALCPQDIHVDPNWTPLEAVVGFLMARGYSYGDAVREARRWLEVLDLWDLRRIPAIRLSGGQQKRIAIAMTLATNTEIMFLDEPTVGLDVEAKYRVWKALRELVTEGRTIVMTTHDMREAEIVSDTVVLIHRGKVVAYGDIQQLVEKNEYRYRLILRKPRYIPRDAKLIDMSDKVIVYARDREEASHLAREIDAEDILIERTGLEDIYLKLVGGTK